MRPGRFHPGNDALVPEEPEEEEVASMRPGRFHPGNRLRGESCGRD